MIRLSDRFEIDSDKFNWILHDVYIGQDREGNPTRKSRVSYHATLEQVSKTIVERSAKECRRLQEVVELMKKAAGSVEQYLSEQKEINP